MKLKNKKTGGLANIDELCVHTDAGWHDYYSLAELNKEWEDYEEPKDHWHIGCEGDVFIDNTESCLKIYSSIGNDFATKEEAEKAVEKLKAVKRLKDKGFRFDRWENDKEKYLGDFVIFAHIKDLTDIVDDLDLLFGGEE